MRVDGSRCKPRDRLRKGQEVRLTKPGLLAEVQRPDGPPEVPAKVIRRAAESLVDRTEDELISRKPSGIVLHAGSKHPWGWIDALRHAFGDAFLAPIGRLDRDVSGLIICARSRAAARRLDGDLRDGALFRVYTGLVQGRLGSRTIDTPIAIRRGPSGRQKSAAIRRPDAGDEAREAHTEVRALRTGARTSLVELRIETGRTHQIRAHLASIGHPLLGDPRYGDDAGRERTRELGLERLFLHAGELHLRGDATDPEHSADRSWRAALPDALEDARRRAEELEDA